METKSEPGNEVRAGEVSGGAVFLGRLMWMIPGPILSFLITYAIVTREGWFTTWDAAFGVVVAMMVGGRWVEQRYDSVMAHDVRGRHWPCRRRARSDVQSHLRCGPRADVVWRRRRPATCTSLRR